MQLLNWKGANNMLYKFYAVNMTKKLEEIDGEHLPTRAEMTIEIEAITIAEAFAKGKKLFFEKFDIEPEESRIQRK